MKSKFGATCVLICSMAAPLTCVYAADLNREQPATFVKDSAITSLVKTKLAAEHLASLTNISVETDEQGVVWLSGSVDTQAAVDKAESIARNTSGVRDVKNQLIVKPAN